MEERMKEKEAADKKAHEEAELEEIAAGSAKAFKNKAEK